MHQKALFLQQLYYNQIGFKVLVPGTLGRTWLTTILYHSSCAQVYFQRRRNEQKIISNVTIC